MKKVIGKRITTDLYTAFSKKNEFSIEDRYYIYLLPSIKISGTEIFIESTNKNMRFDFVNICWLFWNFQINISIEYENTE